MVIIIEDRHLTEYRKVPFTHFVKVLKLYMSRTDDNHSWFELLFLSLVRILYFSHKFCPHSRITRQPKTNAIFWNEKHTTLINKTKGYILYYNWNWLELRCNYTKVQSCTPNTATINYFVSNLDCNIRTT